MERPFVFIFLPKTGSSPLLAHMAEHLVWNEGIVYLGPWGDRQRHVEARPDISVWSKTKLSAVKVVAGPAIGMDAHEAVGAKAGRYLTVFRDPADRMVGEYNARLDAGEDLGAFFEWYDTRRVNRMTRHFTELFGVESVDEVSAALKTFWFATTTEHLHDDAPHVLAEMGLPTQWDEGTGAEGDLDDADTVGTPAISGKPVSHIEVNEEIRDRVYADNPKDLRLLKLVLKRRLKKRARFGWD